MVAVSLGGMMIDAKSKERMKALEIIKAREASTQTKNP
jgi:hypothetical protein